MAFSQQLISEIADHLSEPIVEFISKNEFGFTDNFNSRQIVSDTLSDYMTDSIAKDRLNEKARNERKQRKKKKLSWKNKVVSDYEKYQIQNTQNPFFGLWTSYNTLPLAEKTILKWNRPFEEIVNNKIKEIEAWSIDENSLLIDFPVLSMFRYTKIYKSLESDVFMEIYQYLKENYDLNINKYQIIYTDTMINNPIFGEKKEKLNLRPAEDGKMLFEQLIIDKYSAFNIIINNNEQEPDKIKGLGPQDLAMIQYGIFNNITDSFYTDRQVYVRLREFAKILCPGSKYNKDYLVRAANALQSYQSFRFQVQDLKNGTPYEGFDLFDHIQIQNPADFISTDEDPYSPDAYVYIHFGNRLYKDIIEAQIIGITQSSYDKVDSELAHLLAPVLQMQRTILSKDLPEQLTGVTVDDAMTKTFDYPFFASSVRTLTRRKQANIQRIKNALQEYVDANLFIKSFKYKDDRFTITFYPLSEDELADISIHSRRDVEGQINMLDIVNENI